MDSPLLHNDIMVTDEPGKVTLLNNFFVSKTVLDYMSTLLPDYSVEIKDLNIDQAIVNYHPISLLSSMSKVLEKLLFDHIFGFLKDNPLINIL